MLPQRCYLVLLQTAWHACQQGDERRPLSWRSDITSDRKGDNRTTPCRGWGGGWGGEAVIRDRGVGEISRHVTNALAISSCLGQAHCCKQSALSQVLYFNSLVRVVNISVHCVIALSFWGHSVDLSHMTMYLTYCWCQADHQGPWTSCLPQLSVFW